MLQTNITYYSFHNLIQSGQWVLLQNLVKGHIIWACAFSRVKWLLSKHNCWCFEFKCSVLHHTNRQRECCCKRAALKGKADLQSLCKHGCTTLQSLVHSQNTLKITL